MLHTKDYDNLLSNTNTYKKKKKIKSDVSSSYKEKVIEQQKLQRDKPPICAVSKNISLKCQS